MRLTILTRENSINAIVVIALVMLTFYIGRVDYANQEEMVKEAFYTICGNHSKYELDPETLTVRNTQGALYTQGVLNIPYFNISTTGLNTTPP